MFGSASSVQNFDILANAVKSLILTKCGIPLRFVHRQLDDVPIVAPDNTEWCREFYKTYKDICESLNLELAKECTEFDKAFGCSKRGKLLAILFNTPDLTWCLPEDKRKKTITEIINILQLPHAALSQIQSLMGRINFISSMCPFLNTFMFNQNATIAEALKNESATLNENARKDLSVWLNFLENKENWIPIPNEPTDPPLGTLNIWTDAAGFPDNAIWTTDIGYGTVGTNMDGDTILGYQSWWDKWFITNAEDSNGKRFGNKTGTLEMMALLLPLLLIPEKLRNSHICILTDNMSCVFGMKDGYTKNYENASIFRVHAAHLIGGYLGSIIHVSHCPRRSSWESRTADNLTRRMTTSFLEKQILGRYNHLERPGAITEWMKNPTNNWDLPTVLLNHVMSVTKCE
jgi:hypothetical protein